MLLGDKLMADPTMMLIVTDLSMIGLTSVTHLDMMEFTNVMHNTVVILDVMYLTFGTINLTYVKL